MVETFPYLHSCVILPNRHVELNKQCMFVGINSTREVYKGCGYGEHAEMAAIRKLLNSTKMSKGHCRKGSNRKVKIDFWINRTGKNGSMKFSKPCGQCIKHMNNLEKKGYKIVNIYYPDKEGGVIKVKFTDLLNSEDKHLSHRFR
jgi:cytidine deaminase